MTKQLTEDDVRRIVQEENRKNYMSGSPDIAPHSHNGTDGLNIDPVDLIGWSSIPSGQKKYLNQNTGSYELGYGGLLEPGDSATSHGAQYIVNPSIATYPVIIIQGNGVGVQGAFNGGYAPDGTLVFFDNGDTLSNLYIRTGGVWRGVNFPLVL